MTIHEFASFDGGLISSNEVTVNGVSSGLLYGKSVFTTIAVYHFEPFQWDRHWLRLKLSADRIGIDLTQFSEEFVLKSLDDLLRRNGAANGRVRVTFLDQTAPEIWKIPLPGHTSLLITSADFRTKPQSIDLTISPYTVNSQSPLTALKSGNYLENVLALREAAGRGCSEAVRLNERDEVVSACMANIFWVKDDKCYTPHLDTGALDGTTRAFILSRLNVHEVIANAGALEAADTIFITSAGIEYLEIRAFDKHPLPSADVFNKLNGLFPKGGPVTGAI